MTFRVMMLRLGVACMLAGVFVAPLAAQTANNSNSTTNNQGVNDVLPLLVALSGPENWAYIGSAAGFGGGTGGGGGGQWMRVAEAPELPALDPQVQEAVASVTTTDGRTLKDVKFLKLVPRVGDGLIIGDRALLIHAGGSEMVPLDSLGDEARKSLGLETAAPAERGRGERDAKFWADVKLLFRDWRQFNANPRLLDWLMVKDLGATLDRHARARALANWLVKQWEPWEAKNIDPATGRPSPRAEPLPLPPY
jgi:hypothetical protein